MTGAVVILWGVGRWFVGVAGFGAGLFPGWVTGFDGSSAFQLEVELKAQQDRDVGDPEPEKEEDHGGC